MEFQNPPSKIARLAHSRNALASCWNMERNESPPVGLGLELGRGGSSQRSISSCIKSYGFTVLQLQELQLQSLIYKYIEAGFPVPYHLFFPIWQSVGGLSYSSLHQLYPSFKGCNPLYLEYKNSMDPEPGRCRRTDGKKWRCSKEALPDQKYCDRHMHRGRQRSRKPVEAPSQSSTITSTDLSISLPGMFNSTASSGTIGNY